MNRLLLLGIAVTFGFTGMLRTARFATSFEINTVDAPFATTERVLIDVGNSAFYGGTITTNPNNGLYWNNMTDARPGIRVSNAVTTSNQSSGINIEVINRIDGTYNPGYPGMGQGNTVGNVGDYPASATTDHALLHSSATNGRWRISGLVAGNTYTVKFWGARSNTTASREAEMKLSDETTWKSYNATSNTNYNQAIVFTFTGKTQVDVDMRTKAGSDFSALNVIDISYTGNSVPTNQPPVAKAGNDANIQLPLDSVILQGCTSSDPENAVLSYQWRKISGPTSFTFSNNTLCNSVVRGLTSGTYEFELTVTDNGGLTAKDSVKYIVLPPIVINQPPVARAGSDANIQLPLDSVILQGCTSSDPENGALAYQWRKIGGPASFSFSNNSLCNSVFRGLTSGTYEFELTVTDNGGLTAKDSVKYTVLPVPVFDWPPVVAPICNKAIKIVVLGSSTAYGTGANPIDSSWARKFNVYLKLLQPQHSLINLASPGFTSYEVSPTGTVVPAGQSYTVDTLRNITKALSYQPDAIILSLPSNDVARGIPTNIIHDNFDRIVAAAIAQNVPVWVATTQPRNGLSPSENQKQKDLKAWIELRYGPRTVDCWTTFAAVGDTLNPVYGAGDGVHLNNTGHHIIFTRMVAAKIWDTLCVPIVQNPVAFAGNDTTIKLAPGQVLLNGKRSFDPTNRPLSYQWQQVSGPSCNILNPNRDSSSVVFNNLGVYTFRLTITNDNGKSSSDDVVITVVTVPPPIANAGRDSSLTPAPALVLLNGRASSSVNGSITAYQWQQISGPSANMLNPSKDTSSVVLPAVGTYAFRLTVTDNLNQTATDDVVFNVTQITVGKKSVKVNLFGGSNPMTNPAWNNWNVTAGLTINGLKWDDNTSSNLSATLSESALLVDNGTGYASGATVCPPEVLRYNSASTISRNLTIGGLTTSTKYNIELYGSRSNAGNSTVFQLGNLYDTISTSSNSNDYAKFSNISPDASGRISINFYRIGTWTYLGGFMISEATLASRQAKGSQSLPIEIDIRSNGFLVYPNPAQQSVQVKIDDAHVGQFRIRIRDLQGGIIWEQKAIKSKGSWVGTVSLNKVSPGLYQVEYISTEGMQSQKLVVVK